jgi:large subunit ribosomal protein L17
MRHQKTGRKLGRTSAHRQALLRNLVTSLLLHERIVTTEAKAKELRRIAEQMITLAKRESLHARRQASRIIMDENVLKKLFDSLGARFSRRSGGYTRIIKLSHRAGDGAPLAVIELLDQVKEKEKSEAAAKKKAKRGLGRPKAIKKEGGKEKPQTKEAKEEKEKKGKPAEGKRKARPPKMEERRAPGELSAEQA